MGRKTAYLLVMVRFKEEFGLFWFLLRPKLAWELEYFSTSRSDEQCLCFRVLAYALCLRDDGLDIWTAKSDGTHLDKGTLLDPPDYDGAVFVPGDQACLRGPRIQGIYCSVSRWLCLWSASSDPSENLARVGPGVQHAACNCLAEH